MMPTGRLAENIVHFVRLLRAAGIPVGPERSVASLEAVQAVGISNRDDFRAALAAVLISRQEHRELFDEAFGVFWRNPKLTQKRMASLLPKVQAQAPPEGEQVSPRLAAAFVGSAVREAFDSEMDEVQFDASFTFSPTEVLRHRDFEAMTADELAATRSMLARLRLPLPELPTRRSKPAVRGQGIDVRRTMRRATTGAGALVPLARRQRRRRGPSLVILCDISGSMDSYSRILMHFLHTVTNDRDRVHVFVFGTRLTNVTRQLRHRDVDVALKRVGAAASDWAGGTRIGACLTEFNKRWSRRVLAQDAIVLLISDGLDADAGEALAPQMDRLSRSCRRVVWLNPLLRYDRFEPRPAGIRAMLPYVDDFLPCHNVDSVVALAAAFDAMSGNRSRAWR
ncbi:MAG: VWA domain-containing protein [Gemmatimonadales bacterium]